MPKSKANPKRNEQRCEAVVVSIGCPSGIGPEVSVAAAAKFRLAPVVLVGDRATIEAAAALRRIEPGRLLSYPADKPLVRNRLYVLQAGPKLGARDRKPGRPSRLGGQAQLEYIDRAYDLVKATPNTALVTGPVSKLAIASCGLPKARRFRGHTEWLQARDRAATSVMCFASEKLTSSLATTHVPLGKVCRELSPERVADATVFLARLLEPLLEHVPRLVVCSVNPHAGEGELLGREESQAIVPGIERARRALGRSAQVTGPLGAETAFRKALARHYDGVVAMYHDQATIPMKLVAFGDAVNVTMGLSIVRTSVDHGTGYDIAWRGIADESGMLSALRLGAKLARVR